MTHPRWLVVAFSAVCLVAMAPLASAQTSFRDDFSNPVLDTAWSIRPGSCQYSLTDNPGYLRYILANTHPTGDDNALWIYRQFSGTDWTLEFKANYYLPWGLGRQLYVRIPLGGLDQRSFNEIVWYRWADYGYPINNGAWLYVYEGGPPTGVPVPSPVLDTYWVRVVRRDQLITVFYSTDGTTYTQLSQHTFATPLPSFQTVLLSGGTYYSYGRADYDYISLTDDTLTLSCVPAGFMPPFDVPIALKKQNRTIPLKMMLQDSLGNIISGASIMPPVVNVEYLPQYGPAEDVTSKLLPLGTANEDNIFRFDPATSSWIYNLRTKFFTARGIYRVTARAGDLNYVIDDSCSGTFVRNR